MPIYEYTKKQRNPKNPKNPFVWFYYTGKYVGIDGESRQYRKRGFATKKEAKEQESIFLLSEKEFKTKITLDELFVDFIIHSKLSKKESTYSSDQKRYDSHIKKYFGKRRIDVITTKDITRWLHNLQEKGYAFSYIDTLYSTFNKLYNFANRMDIFSKNPVSKVGAPKNINLIEEKELWNEDEFSKFIEEIDDQMYNVIFRVFFFCGLRRGELLALTWNDYENGAITINKTCSQAKGGFKITPPKTKNSYRTIKLNKQLSLLINEYKKDSEKEINFTNNYYMFGGVKPLPFENVRRKMMATEIKANVKHIRIHDLRHSFITSLVNANAPISSVAELAGDTIETIIKTYVHSTKESMNETLNIIDKSYEKVCQKYAK